MPADGTAGRSEINGGIILKKHSLTGILATILVLGGCGKADAPANVTGGVEMSERGLTVSTAAQTQDAGADGVVTDTQIVGGAAGTFSQNMNFNYGNLSASGSGYEGTPGTGNFNYGEALQKSLLFYELQRSGDLPEEVRCNWRGDSGLSDGADNGVDLTGGWYDAGDHVKFNLPMSYSGTMLAWSLYEDPDAYTESGQMPYLLGDLKWVCDYLIKCHTAENEYYYQVGNGGTDHSWWGPAEVMTMERPSYKVTKDAPGATVVAGTAACLAAASVVFEASDPAYAQKCLEEAKSLYRFADETRSDTGYTMADGFYNSWSGCNDELSWAGAWLYIATGEQSYLEKAKQDYASKEWDYNWALCWDDKHIGAALMLAQITGEQTYKDEVEKHLDWWTTGTSDGERITYTPKGLAWLDSWGSVRYATTTAFVAAVYSEWEGCPAGKANTYWDFAVSQADYALGSTGFSYLIGFGDNYPVHPHHRTAQGSYSNNMNEPQMSRHILYGALVGGPDASDGYTDEVSNYNTNEVACDYNAGFTGLMAKLYTRYHGQTIKDFGAIEAPGEEFFVEGGINVDGSDFVEIKAFVYNESAWPARAATDVELRYYIDLSEVISAGGSAAGVQISNNYMSGGRVDGLKVWDEANDLYYLSVVFEDGELRPGGQSEYKRELQIRMQNPGGPWDNSNDPSFEGLSGTNGQTVSATGMALYEGGKLVFGTEPAGGSHAGEAVSATPAPGGSGSSAQGQGSQSAPAGNATATNGELSVSVRYDNMGASSSALAGTMEIKNLSNGSLSLKDLEIDYYFTKDGAGALIFDCYHAAVNGATGSYSAVNGVNGTFSNASGTDADTVCKMSFSDATLLEQNATLTVNFSIHRSDWGNMTTSNDYSVKDAEHIVFRYAGKVIFGTEP